MRILLAPIGFPGSGKTKFYDKISRIIKLGYVDMDAYKGQELSEVLTEVLKTPGDLYLDGLFLTKKTQNILLDYGVEFIYFDITREQCIINDLQRNRTLKCTSIINNAQLNKPDKKDIFIEIKGPEWNITQYIYKTHSN